MQLGKRSRRLTRIAWVMGRRHGPTALVWRRRIALGAGAVAIGLAALVFANFADRANGQFERMADFAWWLPLIVTPLAFAAIAWVARRAAPETVGSGIPQVIAATSNPARAYRTLISMRAAGVKFLLTLAALAAGASVGREGPTVQISAAIMAWFHKLLRVQMRASMIIAGGAAGVAAAFNTPLAGVAFAIEELANAYEQRVALLVMTAILISGIVSLGIAGDYVYFGAVKDTLPIASVLLIAPVAGVTGGLMGGLFSRLMLKISRNKARLFPWIGERPAVWALACGAIVAVTGVATGLTWGTGYGAARAIIEGGGAPWWFGPAKLLTTLATALAGLPGGIFAPSLATGAGFGGLLRLLFPGESAGPIALLGMVAYFTGVVRAPLTAVIIIVEATASRGLIMPLFAAALIADGASRLVCKERLYHGLSTPWMKAVQ
jgi:H+/Cl- antiporter ClcA